MVYNIVIIIIFIIAKSFVLSSLFLKIKVNLDGETFMAVKKADVVIVGGGITGCATARELSKYALSVVLVEKATDLSTGTTKANSGILHAGFDPHPGTFKAMTNARGNQLYHELENELSFEIRWTGSLVVAKTEQERSVLEELLERGRQNGVPDMEMLSLAQIFKMEPNLSKDITAALYAPTAGVISPFNAAISFAECAVQNGAEIMLDCEVEGIDVQDGKITAVNTSKGRIDTACVINAAGVEADRLSALAGDRSFMITPRKGEYLLFDSSVSDKLVNSIVFPTPSKFGKGILVCSTYHKDAFIGPDAQNIDDKEDTATTDYGMHLVIERARDIVPDIPLGAVITEFAGLRAIADTNDFVIGPSKMVKGLFHAAGMQSPGLTVAPAVAEMIVGAMKEQGISLKEKTGFKRAIPKKVQVRYLTDEEKSELIKKNPLYGRVICRCETITEGEIVDAINSICGARTVDGVKRRVRAGLGRCQGGFCLPRVTAILARELGIELTDVIKESAGSRLFCEKKHAERI